MSAQTGVASLPPPPPSVRGVRRLRAHWDRLFTDPNPVWLREMRQAARLPRTPVILATLTAMVTLLICSVGGVAAVSAEPAKVGIGLFHTFFTLAFAVVTWVGPAVAASTIASERSGRTWEALELTGLGAARIARGKFLAALTYISLYIVMLAPVGALPFLFGGVTATEIVLAFLLLGVFAVLSVAFGLAMSSKFSSPTMAILITLCVASSTSLALYLGGGLGLSYAAHELWPGVSGGPPVWLPGAYVRADFGLEYLAFLVLAPLALTAVPAWLFYEITIANMAAPSDDRSSRLRVWTLVSGPILTATAILPGLATAELGWFVVGAMLIFTFYLFAAFLVTGEPLGPSHRVEVHWQRQNAGVLRRYLGPGVLKGASLLLWLGSGSLLALLGAGALVLRGAEAQGLAALGSYALCFLVFVVGFGAWARARSNGAAVPRVLLLVALFLAVVGPWIVMAMAGIFATSNEASVMAAPSPAYAFFMLNALTQASHDQRVILAAGLTSALAWGLLGIGLLLMALGRTKRRVREERTLREALESPAAQPAPP
ncbi:MAG TPA: ABC transporter permease [Polyangiaceae bacterium]|nr:ABC transporter permease [Polyangiaceae bacterium]